MSIPTGYARVTKRMPCPICERPDWCLVAVDGSKACCARVESANQFGDAGWLHTLDGSPIARREILERPKPIAPDFAAADFSHSCSRALSDLRLRPFAEEVGLSMETLRKLGIGWNNDRHEWTFPMRDHAGDIIGVRTRTESGEKRAVYGSRNGLFYVPGWRGDPIFIPEGPTNVAALIDLGFDAIGRPSCNAGADLLERMVRGNWNIVIVADHDEAKRKPDGSVFYPGQEWGERFAAKLAQYCRSVRLIEPLVGKDVRDWRRAGMTREGVLRLVRNVPIVPAYGRVV